MKEKLYFRRCHRCGGVSEYQDNEVSQCHCCKKPLAPFYYFDEHQVQALTDNGAPGESPGEIKDYYRPLIGLSAFW